MQHPQTTGLTLAGAALLLLTACGGGTDESPPAGDEVEETQTGDEDDAMGDDEVGTGETSDELREEVGLAITDAAEQRGITEEEIAFVRAEEVEWPDGALGCPEEGEMYTQAITPGYLVVLEIEGEDVHYHGAEGEPPFHCEDPQSPTQD